MNSIEKTQNNDPISELPELNEEDWKKIAEQSAKEEKNKPVKEIFDNESPGAWVKEAINLSSLFELEPEKDDLKENEDDYNIDQKKNTIKIEAKQEAIKKLDKKSVKELLALQQQLNALNPADIPATNRRGLIKAQRFIDQLIISKNKDAGINYQAPVKPVGRFYNPLASKSTSSVIKADRIKTLAEPVSINELDQKEREKREKQELIEETIANCVYKILQKTELQESLFNGSFSINRDQKNLLIEFNADKNPRLNCNINIISMKNLGNNIDKIFKNEVKKNIESALASSNNPIYFNLTFNVDQASALFNKKNDVNEEDVVSFIKNQMQDHSTILLLGILTRHLGDNAKEDIDRFKEKLIDNKIDFTAGIDELKKYIETKLPKNKKGPFINKLLFIMDQLMEKEQEKEQVA